MYTSAESISAVSLLLEIRELGSMMAKKGTAHWNGTSRMGGYVWEIRQKRENHIECMKVSTTLSHWIKDRYATALECNTVSDQGYDPESLRRCVHSLLVNGGGTAGATLANPVFRYCNTKAPRFSIKHTTLT